MEPGWQRNVMVAAVIAVWIAGSGLLEVSDGGTYWDGVLFGVTLAALMAVVVLAHRLTSLVMRFYVIALGAGVLNCLYQLAVNGDVGLFWVIVNALGVAAIVIGSELIARWLGRPQRRGTVS